MPLICCRGEPVSATTLEWRSQVGEAPITTCEWCACRASRLTLQIAAINDASNEDSRQAHGDRREQLKEFQESLLVQEYNLAIREQFQGKKDVARAIYLKLLESPLLSRKVGAHYC